MAKMRTTTACMALGCAAVAIGCGDDGARERREPAPQEHVSTPAATRTAAPATTTATESAAAPVAPDPPGERMWGHYVAAITARDAILEGDLEGARDPLAWLAHHRYPLTLPELWRPHALRMQTAARVAARSEDPATAARAVATMAAACGGCHMALDRGPASEPSGWTDETDEGLRGRMHRHAWAVERMWEGLSVPWERAYEVGALVLSEGKAAFPRASAAQAEQANAQLKAVVEHARKAKSATTWVERADAFGDILATCTQCHRALGVRLGAAAAEEPAGEALEAP